MSEVLSWVFAVLFVLVIIAWYLTYTAARLDRLHVRLTGTLAALDAQLVRRAEASLELANSGFWTARRHSSWPPPPPSRWRTRVSTARSARSWRTT